MRKLSRAGKPAKIERTSGTYRKYIHSLDSLFEKFMDAKTAEGLAEGTLKKYRGYYRYFSEFLNDRDIDRDIRVLSKDVMRAYITYMMRDRVRFNGHKYKTAAEKTKGLAPRSVNDRLKILRTFFGFLAEEGLAANNPMEGVKNVPVPDDEIIILTEDEINRLLSAPNQRLYADFRDYVVMNLLLDSFARISEVLTLERTDIDLTSASIRIQAKNAKSRKSRVLPITKRTTRLVRELLKETEDFESEFVFLANYGERLRSDHYRHRLAVYAKRVGIRRSVHPHLFRHTAATWALEDGMDIRHLQRLMGHADLRQLLRYTHLSRESLTKQHEQYSPLNRIHGKLNKPRKIKR